MYSRFCYDITVSLVSDLVSERNFLTYWKILKIVFLTNFSIYKTQHFQSNTLLSDKDLLN